MMIKSVRWGRAEVCFPIGYEIQCNVAGGWRHASIEALYPLKDERLLTRCLSTVGKLVIVLVAEDGTERTTTLGYAAIQSCGERFSGNPRRHTVVYGFVADIPPRKPRE